MLGRGCRGSIPALGPCMTPGLGRVIPDVEGDPSWLSRWLGVLSPLDSSMESSAGCSLLAAKEQRIKFNTPRRKPTDKREYREHYICSPVKMSHLLPAVHAQTPCG